MPSSAIHSTVHSSGTTVISLVHPLPHPEPAKCRVERAKAVCNETLDHLAAITDELSTAPGTKPELRPEFWLHHLRFATGYLLLALEGEENA